MKEIDDIVNGNYTVIEKEEMLADLFDRFRHAYNEAKKKIVANYKYCPLCKEYYKISAWENSAVSGTKRTCVFRDLTNKGNDKYENTPCTIEYLECPRGHRFEKGMVH